MKKYHVIPTLILFVSIINFVSPHAAHTDGQIQYTKEIIVGKWINVQEWYLQRISDYKGEPDEIFIFNADNTFEHRKNVINKSTDKLTLLRTTGRYKVRNNEIHCSNIKEESDVAAWGNMFPETWKIVLNETNVKLDVLELEPDDHNYRHKRKIIFCRLSK